MTAIASNDRSAGIATQINVTPLVDVMLVLLVIFMIAVPLTTQRLTLAIASGCQHDCPSATAPVRLAIKRTGELYWNGSAISHAGLIANLGAFGRLSPPQWVEVHVEANVRYASVADVLTAARNAAVSRISIASAVD